MTSYDDGVTRLSDQQEQVLALLPIPSAFLSIASSSVIIYMILRSKNQRDWSPYKRLLLMMSLCDIMFSITIAVAAFLRPQESSKRLWAFGTEATCSAVGFFYQLSTSALWYNCSLAFYFLLTTRFGMKNADVAKVFEPVMHTIAIGFPILTATLGSVIGLWGEMPVNGLRCYIVDYPKNCGTQPGQSGEECISSRLFIMFYYVPVVLTFGALVVSNILISHFVWKQTNPTNILRRSPSSATSTSGNNSFPSVGDSSTNSDFLKSTGSQEVTQSNASKVSARQISGDRSRERSERRKEQRRRLRLVGSQAFLFVACYTLSNLWPGLINQLKQGAKNEEELMELLHKYYPLMVCEAALLPLQGMFNLIVFIRPKYARAAADFPKESFWWALKRSVFGAEIKPTHKEKPPSEGSRVSTTKRMVKFSESPRPRSMGEPSSGDTSSDEKRDKFVVSTVARLPSGFVSSLTGTGSEHDDELPLPTPVLPEPQTKKKRRFRPRRRSTIEGKITTNGRGGLEIISELSASHFESITEMDEDLIQELEDTEINSDEEDDVSTLTPTASTVATPVLERISTSGSESRWSASLSSDSPSGHSTLEDSDQHNIQMLEMPKRMSSGNLELTDLDSIAASSSNDSIGSEDEKNDGGSEGSMKPKSLFERLVASERMSRRSTDASLVPDRLAASERAAPRSIDGPIMVPRRKISM